MTRPGVRLGIDVGKSRIGVAACDREGAFAYPVETVPRSDDGSDFARIEAIAAELAAVEYVVGLPLNLAGRDTASTTDAREFAARVATGGLPVRLVDERLSTTTASAGLRSAGRRAKVQRPVIDQAAAVIILQQALDIESGTGVPAGELVN